MEDVVKFCAVEDSVMAKVMLQPPCLGLTGHHQARRHHPRQPVVAKVPEHTPGQNVDDDNVS